ncbi:hypothetical protein [Chroococcidiopsis sp.]
MFAQSKVNSSLLLFLTYALYTVIGYQLSVVREQRSVTSDR